MSLVQKSYLTAWIQSTSALNMQFQPAPTPWPIDCPLANDSDWKAFKVLMEAFYEKGFKSGLPYLADGTPTAAGGVTYAQYVSEFRAAHRLNPNPDAREVCVLCGGPLGDTPHVDHWIIKSAFPTMSVCMDNLLLICSTCNEAPNKGTKLVHSNGSFSDWFHPYMCPGNGLVRLNYALTGLTVQCFAPAPADQPKVANLDELLNLSSRWTREFKAEYAKHQDVLKRREQRRIQNAQARHSEAEVRSYIQQWQADLALGEPHFEVHDTLANALQVQQRIDAWLGELGLIN